MKRVTKKNYAIDMQESAKLLKQQGTILMRYDVDREGDKDEGCYTGFIIQYDGLYWTFYMYNGQVYSMGYNQEFEKHHCYPKLKIYLGEQPKLTTVRKEVQFYNGAS
jgi:hypothetical protein